MPYIMFNQASEAPLWFWLLPVEHIYQAQGLSLAYPAQLHLCGIEIFVPQQHLKTTS